jgi:hypothetical protein
MKSGSSSKDAKTVAASALTQRPNKTALALGAGYFNHQREERMSNANMAQYHARLAKSGSDTSAQITHLGDAIIYLAKALEDVQHQIKMLPRK